MTDSLIACPDCDSLTIKNEVGKRRCDQCETQVIITIDGDMRVSDSRIRNRPTARAIWSDREAHPELNFRGMMTLFQVKTLGATRGLQKIGETLFLDGCPTTQCGNPECGLLIKLDRSYGQIDKAIIGGKAAAFGSEPGTREKLKITLKPWLITIGHWLRFEELELDHNHQMVMVIKHRPSVRQVTGCLSCWSKQQQMMMDERARESIGAIDMKTGRPYRARLVMFDDGFGR